MKFSEFKQLMEHHNALVIEMNKGVVNREAWQSEMRVTNNAINDFLSLNRDVFKVDLAYLKRKLNEYIKGVQKAEYVTPTFKVAEYYNEPALVIDVAERDLKNKEKVYHRTYYVGRIISGARHNLCVDLEDILDYGYTHRARAALFNLEGFEETLWQAVEENFNEQVKNQLKLLRRTYERIEQRKTATQEPDYVEKEVAQMDEEEKQTIEKIEALTEQID